MRSSNDNELLFGEREQLLIDSLRFNLNRRHLGGSTGFRRNTKSLLEAIRSIRSARAEHMIGLSLACRRQARTPRMEAIMTRH